MPLSSSASFPSQKVSVQPHFHLRLFPSDRVSVWPPDCVPIQSRFRLTAFPANPIACLQPRSHLTACLQPRANPTAFPSNRVSVRPCFHLHARPTVFPYTYICNRCQERHRHGRISSVQADADPRIYYKHPPPNQAIHDNPGCSSVPRPVLSSRSLWSWPTHS